MKQSEIRRGMKVHIKEAGRATNMIGRGIVTETHVSSSKYGSRLDSTKVHLHDDEWNPRFEIDWEKEGVNPETGRRWTTNEPVVRTYLNAQLISEYEWERRQAEVRKAKEERLRRRALVQDMRGNISAALFKAGVTEQHIQVNAYYVAPENGEPEGVEVTEISIRGDGVKAFMNFVHRELDFMDDDESQ